MNGYIGEEKVLEVIDSIREEVIGDHDLVSCKIYKGWQEIDVTFSFESRANLHSIVFENTGTDAGYKVRVKIGAGRTRLVKVSDLSIEKVKVSLSYWLDSLNEKVGR